MSTCARRTSASIIAGNVQFPWYFLLAHAASVPDSYAIADLFAYLNSNPSQFHELENSD